MPTNTSRHESGPAKTIQCTVCSKRFSRTDHLKRHQLRHTGIRPYACIFCRDGFTRSDNLRDHYLSCGQRDGRQIPDPARGGRRSHACDSCTSMKLGCDGDNPCKTCRQKSIECKYSRLQSKGIPIKGENLKLSQDISSSSDRGSIGFLLNSGTAGFIESFRFPSSHERRNIFSFRSTHKESISSDFVDTFANISENGSGSFSEVLGDESIDWSLFENENLIRFLSVSYGEMKDFETPAFMSAMQYPLEWEQPSIQSSSIIQGVLDRAADLNISREEEQHVGQQLNFLFMPSKISRLSELAFEFWYPHCPILHQGTFDPHNSPLALVASVVIMGAMFSKDEREVNAAKFLLDLVELYVYSMDDLTDDYEIRQMLRASMLAGTDNIAVSNLAFQHLQAAYIILCTQFWAGSMVSRKRAIDTRFATVVKVARRLRLPKARHQQHSSVSEAQWILKESQIRLMNIMTLLDCAFSFFANFPCRLVLSEMKFDLPCEENLFLASNPFAERNFNASRHITIQEAFKSLFGQVKSDTVQNQRDKDNPLGLNPTDMFALIHLLYVHAHTHMTLFASPLSQSRPSSSSSGLSSESPTSPQFPSHTNHPDSNILLINVALSRWRSLWFIIRANTPNHKWATLGFFRNGYNYWLVTQLLINNKGSADVLSGMEVGCDDAVEQLKSLVKDGEGSMSPP